MRGKSLGKGEEPFLNIHSAIYRGVYDFADPDSSVFAFPLDSLGTFYLATMMIWEIYGGEANTYQCL